MYSCGPTVYDYQHIGHMRRYVGDDILVRVLKANGYQVQHVMNITDVGHMRMEMLDRGEDKLIAQARKEGKTSQEIAEFYTQAFHQDEGALNIESLAADGDKLWIGFRNPKNKAKEALLVPLLNPTEAIKVSARAKLGDPVSLKLGGLGVRDMVAWNDAFLIIAGDFADRFAPGAKPSRIVTSDAALET